MAWDLVVIGGGAAGLAAARAARRRDARVALVTDGPLGGDCTWVGCVPSKTLIEEAAAGESFAAAMDRVRATVAGVAAGEDAVVLAGEGVEVVEGRAALAGSQRVDVGRSVLHARRVVVATGGAPVLPPIPGLADLDPLTNETVWELRDAPESLAILGGGPIGVELAWAMGRLGVPVTVIEAAGRLLPHEEPEASALVAGALQRMGVTVRSGAAVVSAAREGKGGRVELDGGQVVRASRLLVAVGRRPVTGGLHPERAGVCLGPRGEVRTDARLRTSAGWVWAAGDVTGRSQHTHAADEMGRVAAGNALSPVPWRRYRDGWMPAVTFTDPEVARVGLTEGEAARRHPGARVAELPASAIDRAVTAARTDGLVKLVVGPRPVIGDVAGGRLLGATVVGPRAGESIAVVTLALRAGMFPARLAVTTLPYPTWTLGVQQAAAALFVELGGARSRPARPAPP